MRVEGGRVLVWLLREKRWQDYSSPDAHEVVARGLGTFEAPEAEGGDFVVSLEAPEEEEHKRTRRKAAMPDMDAT